MQERRLRLGETLDDYCPREKRLTNHVIVALVGDEVRTTRCSTCDTEHVYKQGKVPARRKKADPQAALYKTVLDNVTGRDAEGGALLQAGPEEDATPVVALPPRGRHTVAGRAVGRRGHPCHDVRRVHLGHHRSSMIPSAGRHATNRPRPPPSARWQGGGAGGGGYFTPYDALRSLNQTMVWMQTREKPAKSIPRRRLTCSSRRRSIPSAPSPVPMAFAARFAMMV